MNDAIAHRGPDDAGTYLDPECGVGLGHRRLSIVDLSPTGHQPMQSATGRFVVVFNGEVYNFKLIRAELEQAGLAPAFRGSSDTEVILAAVEAWGVRGAVERFVGMFALALWDRFERRLYLVRDRLGVKPLYYRATSEGIWFGSELSALLAFPGCPRELDVGALGDFLRWGHVPGARCIYEGIAKLEPGCFMQIDGAGQKREIVRYWDPRDRDLEPLREPLPALLEQVSSLVSSAVALRMIADVPLGAFLSGGIDSSLVVALMQRQSSTPVRTFSIGNESQDYDEGKIAARVAQHLGTQHTTFNVRGEDALAIVPELGSLYDEPFADSSQIPTVLVCRLARAEVTVALSGDGGDEAFAGYNRHIWGPRIWSLLRRLPAGSRARWGTWLTTPSAQRQAALASSVLPRSARPRLLGDKLDKLGLALSAGTSRDFYQALRAHWVEPSRVLRSSGADPWSLPDATHASRADEIVLLDLLSYLPYDVLTKVDRASMSVPIEVRSPLLDHRVVELGLRLPLAAKVHGTRGKWILRKLLERHLPAELIDRPKMGFAVPVGSWLRGPLTDWADDLLGKLSRRDEMDAVVIQQIWREHREAKRDQTNRLWPLLMLQSWLDGRHGPSPM